MSKNAAIDSLGHGVPLVEHLERHETVWRNMFNGGSAQLTFYHTEYGGVLCRDSVYPSVAGSLSGIYEQPAGSRELASRRIQEHAWRVYSDSGIEPNKRAICVVEQNVARINRYGLPTDPHIRTLEMPSAYFVRHETSRQRFDPVPDSRESLKRLLRVRRDCRSRRPARQTGPVAILRLRVVQRSSSGNSDGTVRGTDPGHHGPAPIRPFDLSLDRRLTSADLMSLLVPDQHAGSFPTAICRIARSQLIFSDRRLKAMVLIGSIMPVLP